MIDNPQGRYWIVFFLLGLFTVCLVACEPHYPLGISKERWATMTPDERLRAREKQAALDRARAEARRKEAEARIAEAKAREAELAHARAHAQPGQRVQCVLDPVEVKIGKDWRPAQPVGLDLVVGMPVEFSVRAMGKHGWIRWTQRGTASFDGMTIRLCAHDNDEDCACLIGTNRELFHGKRGKILVPDFLRGQLYCTLAWTWHIPRCREKH